MARDPLATIEAAYRTDVDEATWLRGALATVDLGLGEPLGSVGYVFGWRDGRLEVGSLLGLGLPACEAGVRTDQAACADTPTAWGPAASFTSLQTPSDITTVRGTCFDYTGDGLGDSDPRGLAGQVNGPFSDRMMSGAYIALLEFPTGTDFANALPFPQAALTGQSDSAPPQPVGQIHAARITYLSACDPVDAFPEAAIADGQLSGTAARMWVRMPDSFLSLNDSWPSLLTLRDVRLRARVVQGGPDGVELADGVLGPLRKSEDIGAFVARAQAFCEQADPPPEYCACLSVMKSALTLLLNLHCFADGSCVPKSKDFRGNTASLCLTFSAMPASVTGIVPAP
ncbi:MAG TPA: hypothetical protein PLQ97_15190 [Myxococcota bacterium]|nr:hypothetical protein [Myxococcota bacterium]